MIASGNVVLNLREMDWRLGEDGYDWAKRFDEDALMLSNPADAARLHGHTDFRAAVPWADTSCAKFGRSRGPRLHISMSPAGVVGPPTFYESEMSRTRDSAQRNEMESFCAGKLDTARR